MKTTSLLRFTGLLAFGLVSACAAPADETNEETVAKTEDPYSVTNQGWALPYRGGTGGAGVVTWDKCAPDEVVVGLVGNKGRYVNTLGIVCAKLYPRGGFGPDVQHQARGGITDGQFFTLRCPAGKAVTGLYGWSHTYLDEIAIRCDTPPFVGKDVSYDIFGGSQGGDWFFDMCPQGYALHNLGLNWGNWIDGEQAVCAWVDPTLPPPVPPNIVFQWPR